MGFLGVEGIILTGSFFLANFLVVAIFNFKFGAVGT